MGKYFNEEYDHFAEKVTTACGIDDEYYIMLQDKFKDEFLEAGKCSKFVQRLESILEEQKGHEKKVLVRALLVWLSSLARQDFEIHTMKAMVEMGMKSLSREDIKDILEGE